MKFDELKVGDRIELHPATDRWMMGDRYGEIVEKIEGERNRYIVVKFDKSGRKLSYAPRDIARVLR